MKQTLTYYTAIKPDHHQLKYILPDMTVITCQASKLTEQGTHRDQHAGHAVQTRLCYEWLSCMWLTSQLHHILDHQGEAHTADRQAAVPLLDGPKTWPLQSRATCHLQFVPCKQYCVSWVARYILWLSCVNEFGCNKHQAGDFLLNLMSCSRQLGPCEVTKTHAIVVQFMSNIALDAVY